ncbi:hypothetical protein E2C01_081475 [Portunus trituberculatus]|uniref:Uncharacterized protein n=1 Tax=Portunus trituberculatus TaxID=210409 RepID=A0A5B7IPW6_PORTR|nr:hypothetical protein [Portunus trituberculatus]
MHAIHPHSVVKYLPTPRFSVRKLCNTNTQVPPVCCASGRVAAVLRVFLPFSPHFTPRITSGKVSRRNL